MTGTGLPGLHTPSGREPDADEDTPRSGAAPGAADGQPGAASAAAAPRAWHHRRIKRGRIVKARLRWWKQDVRELVMALCGARHTCRVRLTPGQPMI